MSLIDPRVPPDMAKAISDYGVEATEILQAFINTVEAEKPPPVIYHYTNDAPVSSKPVGCGFRTYSGSMILPNCGTACRSALSC
jgi:hypothetical protein